MTWMIIKKKDGLNYLIPTKMIPPVDGVKADGIIDGKS
tara:strand:+ start:59 stop:172 length:114 start_codon:yes stop_codon:yes gene_type:complete